MPLKVASLYFHVAYARLNEISQYNATTPPSPPPPHGIGTCTLVLFIIVDTWQIWEEISQKHGQESKQFCRTSYVITRKYSAIFSFSHFAIESKLFIGPDYCKQIVFLFFKWVSVNSVSTMQKSCGDNCNSTECGWSHWMTGILSYGDLCPLHNTGTFAKLQ